MNDTPAAIEAQYRELLMALSPEKRLEMACSMHETARQMAIAGILRESPNASEFEIARELFLRFHRDDFSDSEKLGFLTSLESWYRRRP